ncbi:Uncharacterised protein [Streptococcus pneumoniae]|nr:Uncharacterised protein [Streptococcus pneumoniae]
MLTLYEYDIQLIFLTSSNHHMVKLLISGIFEWNEFFNRSFD